jgi:hypothetical protein
MMSMRMAISYPFVLFCVRYPMGTMGWLRPGPRPGTGARGRHRLGPDGRYALDRDGRPIHREVAA